MPVRRVCFLAPFLEGPVRGNAVQARRKVRQLEGLGADVLLLDPAAPPANGDAATLRQLALNHGSELVISLHAFRCGPAGMALAQSLGVPHVVAVGGTDVFPGMEEPAWRDQLAAVYQQADRTILQNREQLAELRRHIGPDFRGSVADPAVDLPPEDALTPEAARAMRQRLALPLDAPLVLVVAGLRHVKGIDLALDVMAAVRRDLPDATLALAGQEIDRDYARQCLARLQAEGPARWLPPLTHEEMPALYRAADVVLNTSRAEGVSNAVLEAMACGRPVVASDIPGNRAALRHFTATARHDANAHIDIMRRHDDVRQHEQFGVIARDVPGLAAAVLNLLRNPAAAAALGAAARHHVAHHRNQRREQLQLGRALQQACAHWRHVADESGHRDSDSDGDGCA